MYEKDYIDLIVIINQMNTWNRLAISSVNYSTTKEKETSDSSKLK